MAYWRAVELTRLVGENGRRERRFQAQLHGMQLEDSHGSQGRFRGRRESAIERMKARRGY